MQAVAWGAMAQYTKFPVSAPPAAPERASTSRLLLRAYIILGLAAVFGHPAVHLALGSTGSMIVVLVLTAASIAIWIPEIVSARPTPFAWRRLPWAALAYIAFMIVSALWARAPEGTLRTSALLAVLTVGGLFISHSLTWPEIVNALSSALKWIVGLSLAIELWAALVVQHPITSTVDVGPLGWPRFWVDGNIFEGGPLYGIVGDPYLLAPLCLLAIIVFCALFAARARWRATLILWIGIAAFLLFRSGSTTTFLAALACGAVLAVGLLLRRAQRPETRRWIYAGAWLFAIAVAALSIVAAESGLGAWIALNLSPAHNMWVDARLELGWFGLALLVGVYGALFWRAWFFAVDRPRWDLRTDRPYSPLGLVPVLITTMLLVQGVIDSAPLMMWGWMLAVLLSFKLKAVPLLSAGLSERQRTIERGTLRRAVR